MGYILVFGFPNRNSHRIFVNDLHWKDINEIPTFQLGLSENNKLNNNCINSSHDLDELVIMDNNFELNYNITSSLEIPIQVKKNKTYLIWRYSRHPLNKYYNFAISNKGAASSFCVVKKYLNNLDIIDFQASNKDECEILINYIIRFAFLKKLDNINCWAPRHHFLHQLCEKYGFINREPITYFCCRHLANEKHEQFYDLYCNWYVQMGDSDVY